MSRHHNPWIKLGLDAMALGAEAASVIGLRSVKIATGGPDAEPEAGVPYGPPEEHREPTGREPA